MQKYSTILDPVGILITFINCSIVMFGCYKYQSRFNEYFQIFIEIDMAFWKAGRRILPSTECKFLHRLLLSALIFFVSNLLIDNCYYSWELNESIISFIKFTLPDMIVTCSIYQYYWLLHGIGHRYSEIGFQLRRIDANSAIIKIALLNQCKIFFSQSVSKMSANSKCETTDILNKMLTIFGDLCATHKHVNQLFGLFITGFSMTFIISICTEI